LRKKLSSKVVLAWIRIHNPERKPRFWKLFEARRILNNKKKLASFTVTFYFNKVPVLNLLIEKNSEHG
jgi:hypothetical protein